MLLIRNLTPIALGAALLGCGSNNAAGALASAPEFDPKGQTKCKVAASQDKPLVVEWASADRAELEANAKHGPVVVSYDGCELKMLTHCKASGVYGYTAVTPKKDTHSIRNADELWAAIPIGAAKFESKLATAGQLNVNITTVGRYQLSDPSYRAADLKGSCAGATHVVAGLTVGAFEFFAGAEAEVGGGASVVGVGGGAKSGTKRETLTQDGDPASCKGSGDGPPSGCSALVRIEVVPILAEGQAKGPAEQPRELTKAEVDRIDNSCRSGAPEECDRAKCELRDAFKGAQVVRAPAGSLWAQLPLDHVTAACERLRTPGASTCENGKGSARVKACVALCDGGRRDASGDFISNQPCQSAAFEYRSGESVPKDESRAMALFEKGCTQGERYGCVNVARTLQKKNNKKEAKAAFKKACELGDTEACATYKELEKEPP